MGSDNDYNEPPKNEGREELFGVKAIPGSLCQSGKICTICPICKHVGPTEIQSNWSIKSCLCCYYYGPYWSCYQLFNGKDFIPKDAIHKCKQCDHKISEYKSCGLDVELEG